MNSMSIIGNDKNKVAATALYKSFRPCREKRGLKSVLAILFYLQLTFCGCLEKTKETKEKVT